MKVRCEVSGVCFVLIVLCSPERGNATEATGAFSPWLYFADNDALTVNRMRLDGGDFEVLAHTGDALLGLTVDTRARKVYWSDNPRNGYARLFRANLNGSGVEVVYEAALPNQQEIVGQIALDENSRRVYWIDEAAGRIRGVNLDGSGLADVIPNDPTLATALELDADRQLLYFTTGSFVADTAEIQRIRVDGTGRETLASEYAYSLYLDHEENRVLGTDWDGGAIFELRHGDFERSDLIVANRPRDVQRFGDSLVYNDIVTGAGGAFSRIVRSNLDGTNPTALYEVNLREAPSDPIAMFIVVPEPSARFLLFAVVTCAGIGRYRRWPR